MGDYAYVKGAESTDPAAIYECATAGAWSDSGRTADTSNVQTFASSQEVNDVHIVNDLTTGGVNDVLTAEQGKIIGNKINGKHYSRTISAIASTEIGKNQSKLDVDIKSGVKIRIRFSCLKNVFNTKVYLYANNQRISDVTDLDGYMFNTNEDIVCTPTEDLTYLHIYMPANTVVNSDSIIFSVVQDGIMNAVIQLGDGVGDIQFNGVISPKIFYYAHKTVWINDIAPENSIDGIRLAARAGFDGVEFDVLRTSDGKFVSSHLDNIKGFYRNASDYSAIANDVLISENTLDDLRNNYVLASPNVGMRRKLPTFAEMLSACKYYGVMPLVDCKITSQPNNDYMEEIVSLIKRYWGNDNIVFATRSNIARLFSQNLICGPVDSVVPQATDLEIENIISLYGNANGEKIRTSYGGGFNDNTYLTAENVNVFLQNGIRFGVYCSGITCDLQKYLDLGVCEITADNIAPSSNGKNPCFSVAGFSDNVLTNGSVVNGILELDNGEMLRVVNQPQDIYFAGVFIMFELEGSATLTCNGLGYNNSSETITLNAPSRKTFCYQYMIHDINPTFVLSATSNSKVYNLTYNIVKY